MSKFFDDIKDKAAEVRDDLVDKLGLMKNEWPQTMTQPPFNTKGFLPPQLISPTLKTVKKAEGTNGEKTVNSESETEVTQEAVLKKEPGGYTYKDWSGHLITEQPEYKLGTLRFTKDKFNLSRNLPKVSNGGSFFDPYSNRDTLIMFNDASGDYFRYSLQTLNNLNTDFPENSTTGQPLKRGEGSTARLYNFLNNVKSTPYENNDPVMFGFEVIIDAVSSPLLNGSIYDFLDQFSPQIHELKSKYEVYEDFKNQFKKLFKTKGTIRVDESLTRMTSLGSNPATVDSKDGFFNPGRRAYMAYFLKKVDGLSALSEKNTPEKKKFLTNYGADVIKLEFYEDVSLSLGTLAHLYKLLYWSKPNGKSLIPENLLRFNCEIVVSECRNFNRVRKAVDSGNLEIIKDNVSRYIYSLRECQFYFDLMTHPDSVDQSNLATTEAYTVQFDYKYSSMKLERWTPDGTGHGRYVGYHNGAIWKLGNTNTRGATYSQSVPSFLTIGGNTLFQNGVTKPFVLQSNFKAIPKQEQFSEPQTPSFPEKTTTDAAESALDSFARRTEEKARGLLKQSQERLVTSAIKEVQNVVNRQTALLNKTLNKILNASGLAGMTPPKNIYTGQSLDLRGRLFYDVRGELLNFVGGLTGNQLAGQTSTGTIVIPPKPFKNSPIFSPSPNAKQLYGQDNFNLIQFPYYAQKWPAPINRK